jgi:serine/threonine protein kinase
MNNIHINQVSSLETHPTRIADQYELHQLIAETALGKFFHAHDLMVMETENRVIMVAVDAALSSRPSFDKTLPRVLEAFSHPNAAVHVTDACHSAGIYWLVFQAEAGELLSERLSNKDDEAMPPATVQILMINLLRAVKDIMPQGGFGFLEPGAIFCTGETCKLLNAPLVVILRVLNSLSDTEGKESTLSSSYISPETALGLSPTPQDDAFSLACIAYHLLSGSPPFGTSNTLKACTQQITPSPPPNLEVETWKSLQRGLSLQRMARQASPYELLHAFTETPADKEEKPASRLGILLKAAILVSIALSATYIVRQFFYEPTPHVLLPKQQQVATHTLPPATTVRPVTIPRPIEPVLTVIPPKDLKQQKEQKIIPTHVMATSTHSLPKKKTARIADKKTIETMAAPPLQLPPPVQTNIRPTPPHSIAPKKTATVAPAGENTFVVVATPDTPKPVQQPANTPNNALSQKVIPTDNNTFSVIQN